MGNPLVERMQGVRHDDLRRDVGAGRRAPARSTSARASPTPTGRAEVLEAAVAAIARRRTTSTRRARASPSCAPAIAAHQRRFYGLDVRPRHRGAGHRRRHRGDRRRAARAVRAGRRGRRLRAVLRLLRRVRSRWPARVRRPVTLRAARLRASTPTRCAPRSPPRTRLILLNSPHNPTGKVLHARRARADRRAGASSTTWSWSPTRSTSTCVFDGASTSRSPRCPGMRERTLTISSARQDVLVSPAGRSAGSRGPADAGRRGADGQAVPHLRERRRRSSRRSRSALGLPDDVLRRARRATCRRKRDLLCDGLRRGRASTVLPPGGHVLRHRRHRAARARRRRWRSAARCPSAAASSAVPDVGVLRRPRRRPHAGAVRVLQARRGARRGRRPARRTLSG